MSNWLSDIKIVESPNCDERPSGCDVDLLVIHCISLPPGKYGSDFIENFFLNQLDPKLHPYFETIADMHVSAHFLIKRTGEIIQFVPTGLRAWHAGPSIWKGRERCNDYSIGIELEGLDTEPFSESQYSGLLHLSKRIIEGYPLVTKDRIVGHSDISPGRKGDPGKQFDWERYKAELK